ncbi:MAG: SagB/ThcOx family dehydrogenase [Ruminococcus sp.]|nr:SagB/ThcOx family dehydrogenase [Ruminococcus sp.]
MEKKLFWLPNVTWCINENDELMIDDFCFSEQMTSLFPELYFLLCKGAEEETLLAHFKQFPKVKLKRFIRKLQDLQLISTGLSNTYQVFDKQAMRFRTESPIAHDFFLKKENVEAYRTAMLNRKPPSEDVRYQLPESRTLPNAFYTRKSVRVFDTQQTVSFEQFCMMLECSRQFQAPTGTQYAYPSAGGLYPIDCYIHVKKDRVATVQEGVYFFDPVKASLNFVSEGKRITRELHHHLNRTIFDTSAFSIYLFYNAQVSMPKYESRAYYYGIYDAGILTGYLNLTAEMAGISSCCIGALRSFAEVRDDFNLTEHQIFLHSMELGLRKELL